MRKQRQSYSRSHANRGKQFERLIDGTNNQYRNSNFADVRKVPPPVKVGEVEGNHVEGKLCSSTWVDYSGVYKGQAVVFDVKEIRVGINFPLKNLTKKQYEFLHSWHLNGAKAFLLICFWLKEKNEPEIYLLQFVQLETAWVAAQQNGSKSIPLQFFRDHCPRIRSGMYTVHYLEALEAVGVD